jgi:hypothetical protein
MRFLRARVVQPLLPPPPSSRWTTRKEDIVDRLLKPCTDGPAVDGVSQLTAQATGEAASAPTEVSVICWQGKVDIAIFGKFI